MNHARMPVMDDLFGQLWKEYAKSDSRYLAADSLVLTLETITVVCHLYPFRTFTASLTLLTSATLGSLVLPHVMVHRVRLAVQTSVPSSGLHRTSLQRHAILRDQYLGHAEWSSALASGTPLLLGLLCCHECFLDRYSFV